MFRHPEPVHISKHPYLNMQADELAALIQEHQALVDRCKALCEWISKKELFLTVLFPDDADDAAAATAEPLHLTTAKMQVQRMNELAGVMQLRIQSATPPTDASTTVTGTDHAH